MEQSTVKEAATKKTATNVQKKHLTAKMEHVFSIFLFVTVYRTVRMGEMNLLRFANCLNQSHVSVSNVLTTSVSMHP